MLQRKHIRAMQIVSIALGLKRWKNNVIVGLFPLISASVLENINKCPTQWMQMVQCQFQIHWRGHNNILERTHICEKGSQTCRIDCISSYLHPWEALPNQTLDPHQLLLSKKCFHKNSGNSLQYLWIHPVSWNIVTGLVG